jgi:hypothetical protein
VDLQVLGYLLEREKFVLRHGSQKYALVYAQGAAERA